MAKLTQEMKDMAAKELTLWATVNADGTPNIGPKASTRVLDDEHLVFYEFTGRHIWENLKRNPKIAAATVDRQNMKGYRFVGTAELITSGELFEKARAFGEKMKLGQPRAIVKVKVNEIYSLSFPGAGEKVA